MKANTILALAAALLCPLFAAAEEHETAFWGASELQGYAEKLAPEVNEDGFAVARLGDFGSHYLLVLHRVADGPAELHAAETDFYVVQDGGGTLVTGGKIKDGEEVSEGEVRGRRIQGGDKRSLKPGDTVNIPPGVPHQVRLEEGQTITYLIVKVRSR